MVIHQPDHVLNQMGPWCQKHHAKSGLTQLVKDSKKGMAICEQEILTFLMKHTPKGKCPLAGNSVGQDAKFLIRYMPQIMDHLHYRCVDVSTIKELVKRWYPSLPGYQKKLAHRALDDIRESIEELKYYRKHVFIEEPKSRD